MQWTKWQALEKHKALKRLQNKPKMRWLVQQLLNYSNQRIFKCFDFQRPNYSIWTVIPHAKHLNNIIDVLSWLPIIRFVQETILYMGDTCEWKQSFCICRLCTSCHFVYMLCICIKTTIVKMYIAIGSCEIGCAMFIMSNSMVISFPTSWYYLCCNPYIYKISFDMQNTSSQIMQAKEGDSPIDLSWQVWLPLQNVDTVFE